MMMMLLMLACKDKEVYLASGVYTGNPTAGVVGLLDELEDSALSDFEISLDVEGLTATLYPNDDVPNQLELVEVPIEDWLVGCPTPLVTVRNQTFGFSADFQISTVDLSGAIIFASGCMDEAGKNVTEAWLSTETYQDTLDIAGGMTGMLNLVQ